MKTLNKYLIEALISQNTKIVLNNDILNYVCKKFLLGDIDYMNSHSNKIFKQMLNDIEKYLSEKTINNKDQLDGPYLYSNCENLINHQTLKEYKKIDYKQLIVWSKMNNYKRKSYDDKWTNYELYFTDDMFCIEHKEKSEDYFTYIIFKI